jgi:hypothetical protein
MPSGTPSGTQNLVCAECLHEGTETPAVTAVAGTLLCAVHAGTAWSTRRMRHD